MQTDTPKTPARQAHQKRGLDRQQSLLDAAEALIVETGLEGFAMAAVAKRANAAHGFLYQFFPSRAAILAALHVRHMARMKGAVVKASAALRAGSKHPEPKDFLDSYLIPLRDFLDTNPSYRLLRLGMPSNWQGAGLEQALDAGVVAELTDMLTFVAPDAPLPTRKLAARVLLELADALVVLSTSAEMMAESRHLMEIYLKDLAHRHLA